MRNEKANEHQMVVRPVSTMLEIGSRRESRKREWTNRINQLYVLIDYTIELSLILYLPICHVICHL